MTSAATRHLAPARRQLDNGAVVIARQTSTHPAVTFYATLEAGSGFDPDAALGLAHFVSRVIDRGTTTLSADAIADALDGRGISLSTGVTRHSLWFSCTCLAEDVEAVLNLLADVIRRPSFPADQVELRRGSIVTGIRQDEDNPAAVATEGLMALIYPDGHPYGRLARGTVSSVESITRDMLVEFHDNHAGPSGLRLVVVGDCEASHVHDLADHAFGDWAPTLVGPLDPAHAAPPAGRRYVHRPMPGKPQADIAYGYPTIVRADPRYYALTLMNNVLGQYALGGRLGDNIRERQGMAYYVFSSFDANVAEGPLVIRAGVSPENVDRTVAAIDEEVGRMGRDGITPAELADSQRYLVGSMPRVLETNAGIAAFLHGAEYFGLGLDFDEQLPQLLGAVTLDDVNDVARRFLSPDHASIVVAGP